MIMGELTIEMLNQIEYKDLKAQFDKLGVVECWKPGTKKTVMVENAYNLFKEKQALKNEGKTDEEIKDILAERKLKAQEIQEESEKKTQEEKDQEQEEAVEEILEEKKVSKEVLQRNLEIIDANLKGATEVQREILLKKKVTIEKALEEA